MYVTPLPLPPSLSRACFAAVPMTHSSCERSHHCVLWYLVLQLDHILGRYGVFIVERAGSDMDAATDSLARWRHNIHLIHQLIQNDVSSTKVRLFLRRGLSVHYLLPAQVVQYIEEHGLYVDDGPNPNASAATGAIAAEKEKAKSKAMHNAARGIKSATVGRFCE